MSEGEDAASALLRVVPVREWRAPPQLLPPPRRPDVLLADTPFEGIERAVQQSLSLVGGQLRRYFPRCRPSTAFVRFCERNQPPWHIALSPDGRRLALASDLALEVYECDISAAATADSATPHIAASVLERSHTVDGAPWRRLAWSADGSLLVAAHPTGGGRLYSANLDLLSTLPPPPGADEAVGRSPFATFAYVDACQCAAGAVARASSSRDTPHVVHILSRSGALMTYTATAPGEARDAQMPAGSAVTATTTVTAAARTTPRRNATSGAAPAADVVRAPFQLAPLGFATVGALAWAPVPGLVLVAGTGVEAAEDPGPPLLVAVWRPTDSAAGGAGAPSYLAAVGGSGGLKTVALDTALTPGDEVLRLVPAPDAGRVAVLTLHGALLVLSLPALTVVAHHPPATLASLRHLVRAHPVRAYAPDALEDNAFDLCWWDATTLAVADSAGATLLLDASTLRPSALPSEAIPAVGRAPQPVAGATPATGLPRMHLLNAVLAPAAPDSDDGCAVPMGGVLVRSAWRALHAITRSRHLEPPEAALVRYTYSLTTVTAVRPAALLAQLMAQGEYAAALELAQEHGLETDPIYRTQWLQEPVSLFSVRDLLLRIRNRAWTLQEALRTAPPDLATGQALLQHVLALTTEERVQAAAASTSDADATLELDADSDSDSDSDSRATASLSSAVCLTPATVNAVQAQLIAARLAALQRRDKLLTYERSLSHAEDFDRAAAWSFVHRPLLDLAATAACDGNVSTLEILLVRHTTVLSCVYLPLLALLPETLPVAACERLLPACTADGILQPPPTKPWYPEPDWTAQHDWLVAPRVRQQLAADVLRDLEMAQDVEPVPIPPSLSAAITTAWPTWAHSREASSPTAAEAAAWAEARVSALTEIGLPELAFALAARLASRGVPVTDELLAELQLLGTLAYECMPESGESIERGDSPATGFDVDGAESDRSPPSLSLAALRSGFGPAQVLDRLLAGVTDAQATTNALRQRVLPYLRSPVHATASSPSKAVAVATAVEQLAARCPGALVGLLVEGRLWRDVVPDANQRAGLVLDAAYQDGVVPDDARVLADAAGDLLDEEVEVAYSAAAATGAAASTLSDETRSALAALVRHGAVARLLASVSVPQPLRAIRSLEGEAQSRDMLNAILRAQGRRPAVDWEAVLVTVQQLRATWLRSLSREEVLETFARRALLSPAPAAHSIARAMMPFAAPTTAAETAAGTVPERPQASVPRLLSRLTRLVDSGRESMREVVDRRTGTAPDQVPAVPKVSPAAEFDSSLVLPEASAVRVVLAATREMVDAASSPHDPALEEARALLALLPPTEAAAAEDVTLLAVLAKLASVDVDVMPLQLRLASDRAELLCRLVQEGKVLARHELAFERLLPELGLNRHAALEVRLALAERAWSDKRYTRAGDACQLLCARRYSPAWQLSAEIGTWLQRSGSPAKQATGRELIGFAMQHAPGRHLPALVEAVQHLDARALQLANGGSDGSSDTDDHMVPEPAAATSGVLSSVLGGALATSRLSVALQRAAEESLDSMAATARQLGRAATAPIPGGHASSTDTSSTDTDTDTDTTAAPATPRAVRHPALVDTAAAIALAPVPAVPWPFEQPCPYTLPQHRHTSEAQGQASTASVTLRRLRGALWRALVAEGAARGEVARQTNTALCLYGSAVAPVDTAVALICWLSCQDHDAAAAAVQAAASGESGMRAAQYAASLALLMLADSSRDERKMAQLALVWRAPVVEVVAAARVALPSLATQSQPDQGDRARRLEPWLRLFEWASESLSSTSLAQELGTVLPEADASRFAQESAYRLEHLVALCASDVDRAIELSTHFGDDLWDLAWAWFLERGSAGASPPQLLLAALQQQATRTIEAIAATSVSATLFPHVLDLAARVDSTGQHCPPDAPMWLQHASDLQQLLDLCEAHGATLSHATVLAGPQAVVDEVGSHRWGLADLDEVATALAAATGREGDASSLRLSVLLCHAAALPSCETRAAGIRQEWAAAWAPLVQQLQHCTPADQVAFAQAVVWGESKGKGSAAEGQLQFPAQPREVQREMLTVVAALLRNAEGETRDAVAEQRLGELDARLRLTEADATATAVAALGPGWRHRYERARSQGSAALVALAASALAEAAPVEVRVTAATLLLGAFEERDEGEGASAAASASASRVSLATLSSEVAKALLDAAMATGGSGSESESENESESSREAKAGVPTLAAPGSEIAAAVLSTVEEEHVSAEECVERARTLLTHDGVAEMRATLAQALEDWAGRMAAVPPAAWTPGARAVLVLAGSLGADVTRLVAVAGLVAALQLAWLPLQDVLVPESADAALATATVSVATGLPTEEMVAPALSLWAAVCAAAATPSALAALPRLAAGWLTSAKSDGAGGAQAAAAEQLGDAAVAVQLAALPRVCAQRRGWLGAFAALCAAQAANDEAASLPTETEQAAAATLLAAAGVPAAGDTASDATGSLYPILLQLAVSRDAGWAAAAEGAKEKEKRAGGADSDAVVAEAVGEALGGLGIAALAWLVLHRGAAQSLGVVSPCLLGAVLDAAVDVEAGIHWPLDGLGLPPLALDAADIAAQLDRVTAGMWLLRVRGYGASGRSLEAALAMTEE